MVIESVLLLVLCFCFLGFLMIGVPVGFSLGGASFITTALAIAFDSLFGAFSGVDFQAFSLVVNRTYGLMRNWALVALPMFILMGNFLDKSGLAEKLMHSLGLVTRRFPGGLALSVTFIGLLLAASTGIIGASVVLLGMVSLPVMMKANYDKSLAIGTVCGAGTLGILIPPSIMLIIMADRLQLSVGDLFLGAFIPGLLLAGFYFIYIIGFALFRPNAAPPVKIDSKEKEEGNIKALILAIFPTMALILLVLGSIFYGVATPTEASGLGAGGAIILAAINKKLTLKVIRDSLQATLHTLGFLFAIFIGATCFSLVLRLLGGDELVANLVQNWEVGYYVKIGTILFVVFLLGFFLEWIEITLIILPIVGIVILGMDFVWLEDTGMDPTSRPSLVWFCILFAMTLQTSFLTPPVGFALFYVKGVAPREFTIGDIYRGAVPFIVLQVIALALLMVFPMLVLWLPSISY
ncbi:MAG: C4-dicarboxylate ABC transporter [Opitutaceae bacterium]|nr:C4-dicarboxylate ABC transporter [Opitutaceae bacterium]